MGLKISLKPHEKIIVNGAVIANGDRQSNLLFLNSASFLREKDIMIEEAVQSDHDLFYFLIQLLYIDPEQEQQYLLQLETAAGVLKADNLDKAEEIDSIVLEAKNGNCYAALKKSKDLFPDIHPGRKRDEIIQLSETRQEQESAGAQ